MDPDRERELHEQCVELIRMLTAKIRDLEALQSRGVLRDERATYGVEPDDLSAVLGS
jgi:hypothetical protein